MSDKLIRCKWNKPDCFASKKLTTYTGCEALGDCRFSDGYCHFYKSETQHKKDVAKAEKRVREIADPYYSVSNH